MHAPYGSFLKATSARLMYKCEGTLPFDQGGCDPSSEGKWSGGGMEIAVDGHIGGQPGYYEDLS